MCYIAFYKIIISSKKEFHKKIWFTSTGFGPSRMGIVSQLFHKKKKKHSYLSMKKRVSMCCVRALHITNFDPNSWITGSLKILGVGIFTM